MGLELKSETEERLRRELRERVIEFSQTHFTECSIITGATIASDATFFENDIIEAIKAEKHWNLANKIQEIAGVFIHQVSVANLPDNENQFTFEYSLATQKLQITTSALTISKGEKEINVIWFHISEKLKSEFDKFVKSLNSEENHE